MGGKGEVIKRSLITDSMAIALHGPRHICAATAAPNRPGRRRKSGQRRVEWKRQ